jgi:hypothetical protein
MGIKGDQTDLPDLRDLKISQHLDSHIIFREVAILEPYRFAGDLSTAVALQVDLDRPQARQGDSAHDTARGSIIQESVFDPSRVAKFLCHVGPTLVAPLSLKLTERL